MLDARGVVVAPKMEDGSSILRPEKASGDIADNDEACVLAGLAAVGLTADPGKPA